jgi:hypothetical protein
MRALFGIMDVLAADREPGTAREARSTSTAGTHKATSTPGNLAEAAAIAAISARSDDSPCIFQLPATSIRSV